MDKDRTARIISGTGGLSFSVTLRSVFVSMSIILMKTYAYFDS